MPVDEKDVRSKAKELVRLLHNARSRKMDEVAVAEAALRTFAATYAASMESELVELRSLKFHNERLIASLHDMLRRYQGR